MVSDTSRRVPWWTSVWVVGQEVVEEAVGGFEERAGQADGLGAVEVGLLRSLRRELVDAGAGQCEQDRRVRGDHEVAIPGGDVVDASHQLELTDERQGGLRRSEEHTSELQSLMRNS